MEVFKSIWNLVSSRQGIIIGLVIVILAIVYELLKRKKSIKRLFTPALEYPEAEIVKFVKPKEVKENYVQERYIKCISSCTEEAISVHVSQEQFENLAVGQKIFLIKKIEKTNKINGTNRISTITIPIYSIAESEEVARSIFKQQQLERKDSDERLKNVKELLKNSPHQSDQKEEETFLHKKEEDLNKILGVKSPEGIIKKETALATSPA